MNITIQDTKMPVVEYQHQRVVTFAMVDEAHQRPKGTARATFNRNRHRFTEGRHYFRVSAEEARQLDIHDGIKRTRKKSPISSRATTDITLITEMGYLLLVKPFGDDLSWQIQEELINAYFRRKHDLYGLTHVHVPSIEELDAMPLGEAQNLLAGINDKSKKRHGQPGSSGMNLRKRELKVLRPAIKHTDTRGQFALGWESDKGIELTGEELRRQFERGSERRETVGGNQRA